MELRHLRYFLAVAEELHFGRAAARLRIAQPPLSQQIRQLEEEIGVRLFDRTKRRVELTAAGVAFLEEVRRVFGQTERAVRTAQRASRGEVGRLAIGFMPAADLDLLPRVLRRWHARFPNVETELHGLLAGAQIDALQERRIQVAFVRPPVDETGLAVEPVQRDAVVVALPQYHALARRVRVPLAALTGEPLVLFPRRVAPGFHDLVFAACRGAGFAPRVAFESDSMQTNLGLVSAGLGYTLMPATIRNLRRAGVVYRPLSPPVPSIELLMVHRRDERSAVLGAFLQVAREVAHGRSREGQAAPSGV